MSDQTIHGWTDAPGAEEVDAAGTPQSAGVADGAGAADPVDDAGVREPDAGEVAVVDSSTLGDPSDAGDDMPGRLSDPSGGLSAAIEPASAPSQPDNIVSLTQLTEPADVRLKPARPKAEKVKSNGSHPTKAKPAKSKASKPKADDARAQGPRPAKKKKTKKAGDDVLERPAVVLADGRHADGELAEASGKLRRFLVANVVAVALAAVSLALAVGLVLAMLQVGNKSSVDNARTSGLAAAKTYAVELAGYDYRHLNQDFGVVLAHSTPSFRRSFMQSSNALKSTLLKYHAKAKAKLVAAGLVSATSDRVVALVFLDQTVTNSEQKHATTDRSQVEITLVSTNGNWLIEQVMLL